MVRRSRSGAGVGRERRADRIFIASDRIERWIASHPWSIFALTAAASTLVQLITRGEPASWDWVWLSGMIAVSLGLPPAFRLQAAARHMLDRLADRGVLTGPIDELSEQTHRRGDVIGRFAGPLLTAAVLAAFLTRVGLPSAATPGPRFGDLGNNAVEVLLACLAAYFVGRAAGEALAVASLGRRIELGPWTLHVQLGHVDGAAGMKPVGDLYFRQAMVVAVPAVWLVVVLVLKSLAVVGAEGWSALGQVIRGGGWGPWYFILLVVAVGLEIAAFVVPMLSFHRAMVAQKEELERAADQQSQHLHRLVEELPTIVDEAERRTAEARIAQLRENNTRIEQMPTWPVDAPLRRRFTIRNVVLLIPVVANAIGLAVESDTWKTFSDILGG